MPDTSSDEADEDKRELAKGARAGAVRGRVESSEAGKILFR